MSITNVGKVSLTPKGEYNEITTYEKLDVVSYGGSSYIALDKVQGVVPADDKIHYMLLAEKGERGLQGETGPQGQIGPQGQTGETGERGPQGEIGATGPQGERGPQGETGKQGPKGEPGSIDNVDPTLSIAGQPADAKATGDAINNISPEQIQDAKILNFYNENYVISNLQKDTLLNYKGDIEELVGYSITPKIYLKSGSTFTMSREAQFCYLFDEADTSYRLKISQSNNSNPKTFEIPVSVKKPYLIFSDKTAVLEAKNGFYHHLMIVEGDAVPPDYVSFSAQIPWLSISDKQLKNENFNSNSINADFLKDDTLSGEKFQKKSIKFEKLKNAKLSKNLFNEDIILHDTGFNNKGYFSSSLDYFATKYISVEPGSVYYLYILNGKQPKVSTYALYGVFGIDALGNIQKLVYEDSEFGKVKITIPENIVNIVATNRQADIPLIVIADEFFYYIPQSFNTFQNARTDIFGLFADKSYVALGDSITRGCSNGETLPDGTVLGNGGQIPEPYSVCAAKLMGMNCLNLGVDGATVKTVIARINDPNLMAGLKYTPDIITCMIGTNDMAQVPLGTIEDVYDSSSVTYYSGLKEIARLLSEKYLSSKIVFLTPLRAAENARQFVKAMEEVADMYDIPCMPMHKVLRYMQKNAGGEFYINDYYNGLHPNQAGHFRMGTALAGFLNSI